MNRVNAANGSSALGGTSGAGWGRRWSDRAEARCERRRGEATFTLPSRVPAPVFVERRRREETLRRPRPAAAFVAQLLGARLQSPVLDEAQEIGLAEARYHAASPEARPTRQGSLVRRDV